MTDALVPLLAKTMVALLALLAAHGGQSAAIFAPRSASPTHTQGAAAASFVPPAANRRPVGGAPPSSPFGDRQGQARELTGLRTRTSRTFTTGSGDRLTRISAASTNYQDASGKYQPIDDTLVPTRAQGYSYRNRSNRYTLSLPADIGGAPMRIEAGGAWLTSSLVGARGRGRAAGTTDVFPNVLSGVTVTEVANADGVDEVLTLAGPSAPATCARRSATFFRT